MGPHDDATDGEHPPVYLPSLSAGDNRGLLSKALKGSGAEKPTAQPKSNCASPLMKKAALEKGKYSFFHPLRNSLTLDLGETKEKME